MFAPFHPPRSTGCVLVLSLFLSGLGGVPLKADAVEVHDDFDDGPTLAWEFNPAFSGTARFEDGDLVLECPGCDTNQILIFRPTEVNLAGDVSAQITGRSEGQGDLAVGVHGTAGAYAYFGRLHGNGAMRVQRVNGAEGSEELAATTTSFLPGPDYSLRLDATQEVGAVRLRFTVAPTAEGAEEAVVLEALDPCDSGPCFSSGLALVGYQLRQAGAVARIDSFGAWTRPLTFRRGGVTTDGVLDITDPITNIEYQFLGEAEPPCLDACDFNDDGVIELTDPILNLAFQFLGGEAPAAPGEKGCGPDPTPDDGLGCDTRAPESCGDGS